MEANELPANPYLPYLDEGYCEEPKARSAKASSRSATRPQEVTSLADMEFEPAQKQGPNKKAPLKQIGRVFNFISNKSNKR